MLKPECHSHHQVDRSLVSREGRRLLVDAVWLRSGLSTCLQHLSTGSHDWEVTPHRSSTNGQSNCRIISCTWKVQYRKCRTEEATLPLTRTRRWIRKGPEGSILTLARKTQMPWMLIPCPLKKEVLSWKKEHALIARWLDTCLEIVQTRRCQIFLERWRGRNYIHMSEPCWLKWKKKTKMNFFLMLPKRVFN